MNKDIFNTNVNDLTYGRGYVYSLQYHIVWCTKYRRHVLTDGIAVDIKEYLSKTADDLEITILAMEVMPDHIHLLLDCKPQFRPSDGVKVLKGNLARWLFMAHPEIKKELWGGHLWNPSYFVSTVSERSEEQVPQYIRDQKTGPSKMGRPPKQ